MDQTREARAGFLRNRPKALVFTLRPNAHEFEDPDGIFPVSRAN
jgi:hypothetical protein